MDLHRLAELRSLAFHQRVAEQLAHRPELLARARERAERWVRENGPSAPYAREWLEILSRPVDEIRRALLEDTERGRARRQATPFAGALEPRERWQLWRDVRAAFEAGVIA